MIMLCKHCLDILGYDNIYTNRVINHECECCKKGLRQSDVIFADDLLVDLLLVLNKDLCIKTYYSCIGHLVPNKNNKFDIHPTYLVVEDTDISRYIFEELCVLNGSIGKITKDGKNKIRITFTEIDSYESIVRHAAVKVGLIDTILGYLKFISKRFEFEELKKK